MEKEEFEKSLEGLSPEEATAKRVEFAEKQADDYRSKLNIQNRLLEKEGFEFKDGGWVKKPEATQTQQQVQVNNPTLSPKDSVLLAKSVDADDIDEVLDYANYRKISVADALKDTTLVSILKERQETRRTAQATQINSANRTSQRDTAESMLQAATQNQVPADDDGIQALAAARIAEKAAKKK